MDPGTNITAYEEGLQKKFEKYRAYVKEIESQFDWQDDDDLTLTQDQINYHLMGHENIHKLRGKRRKLVTEA